MLIIGVLGIIIAGVPLAGFDAYFHLNNLAQYIHIQNTGIVIPRWTPNSYFGFGSATFYFYPPLTYFLGSVLFPVVGSFSWSFRMLIVLCLIGMFFSSRWYFSTLGFRGRSVWLASCFYSVGPYPLYDFVIRSNFPEYLSLVWIPMVLGSVELSLRATNRMERASAIVMGSISCSLLVLSSIPITAMLAWVLIFYCGVRSLGTTISRMIPFLISIVLACLLSAFYLFPVLAFKNAVHLNYVSTLGNTRWFGTSAISSLLHGTDQTDSSIAILFFLLSATILLFWVRNLRFNRSTFKVSWVTALSMILLMQFPFIAHPLLEWVPFLGVIQFPPRFYAILGLALSTFLLSSIRSENVKIMLIIAATAMTVILGIAFLTHALFIHQEFPIEPKAHWSALEYVPIQVPGDTASVQAFATQHQNDPEISALAALPVSDTLSYLSTNGTTAIYHVSTRDTLGVRFHRFYWPGWKLSIPAKTLLTYADSNGILCSTLPSGNYLFTLEIVRSPSEKAGVWVSLCGVILLLGLLIVSRNPISGGIDENHGITA